MGTECNCAGTLTKAHTHASPGFGRGAVELVLGVQRPHRLAADSMIHKRAKEKRAREGVSEKKCELAGETWQVDCRTEC